MAELFTDLASSTLASGISIGATSLTVQAGDGALYPSPTGSDFFTVFLFKKLTGESEFVTCTSRTGDVLTVGATTYAYNGGDVVELRPTAAFFNSLSSGATSTNIQNGSFLYGVDTGATDAYTVAMTPTATVIADGQEVRVKIGAGNTNSGGAATLQLDAVAAKSILMEGGGNPPAGSIVAGYVHTFTYDGTNFIFKPVGLALTSSGFNALAKQIKNVAAGTAATDAATIGGTETLTGKTLTSPTINTPTIATPTITDPAVSGTVTGDPDLSGDPTVRSEAILGYVNLSTQQQVQAQSSTLSSWTTVDMSTAYAAAVTAGAKFYELTIRHTGARTSTTCESVIYLRPTGSGLAAGSSTVKLHDQFSVGSSQAISVNQYSSDVKVAAGTNGDFDWYHTGTGISGICTIWLSGYWV